MTPRPLDLATFSPDGLHVIEASAGTGKTYTLAHIFLRFVLEQSREPRDILVVTFTRAATYDLRTRIRLRIQEALAHAEGRKRAEDPTLADLLDRFPAGLPTAAARIRNTLALMDQSAIFTIHSFCQRVLEDNAFEAETGFRNEFLENEDSIRLTAAEDFWRREVLTLPPWQIGWVLKEWDSPRDLLGWMGDLLPHREVALLPELPVDALGRTFGEWALLWKDLGDFWRNGRDSAGTLRRLLSGLDRRTYGDRTLDRLLSGLDDLLGQDRPDPPDRLPEKFDLLSLPKIGKGAGKKAPPDHPVLDLATRIAALAEELPRLVRCHFSLRAIEMIREGAASLKSKREQRSYDDLVLHLDRALRGAGGEELARRIARRFPVALVDEFQDTDPVQYRIFRTLFRKGTLILIGDPKQAIYGFRGADVHAYLTAKREAGSSVFTLTQNFRSTGRLIDGLNLIFRNVRESFSDPSVPFDYLPLSATGPVAGEGLRIGDREQAPFRCRVLPPLANKETKNRHSLDLLAGEISFLLAEAGQGRATLAGKSPGPRDMAVLVSTNWQAQAVQERLRKAGIGSVYLSSRSVFRTPQAATLEIVMRAVASPRRAPLLKSALATELFGHSAREIAAFEEDDRRSEALIATFESYLDRWIRFGFDAFFRVLLREQEVAGRLLAYSDGERRMTNYLHLAELVSKTSRDLPDADSLIRWLGTRRHGSEEWEEEQIRLDNNDSLVTIVTIHRCKGLEYPLVFLPFFWDDLSSPSKEKKSFPVLFHDPGREGRLTCDLGCPSEWRALHLELRDKERNMENLRLLYVALTRARFRNFLVLDGTSGAPGISLLKSLLPGGGDSPDLETLSSVLGPDGQPVFEIASGPPDLTPAGGPVSGAETGPLRPREPGRSIRDPWRITSFSEIVLGAEIDPARPDRDLSLREPPGDIVPPPLPGPFDFPRGTRTGLFLHDLFEGLDFSRAREDSLSSEVLPRLERYGFPSAWEPGVSDWVKSVLSAPLDGTGFSLSALAPGETLREMAFHHPLSGIGPRALSDFLAQADPGNRDSRSLSFPWSEGVMKGFMDLVFRRDGRYYLADYKSNHLGGTPDDYRMEILESEARRHFYDLQVLIYIVALHRYLGTRIRTYDYDRDFGGAFLLFLRGMSREEPGRGVLFHRPAKETVLALDTLFRGEPSR